MDKTHDVLWFSLKKKKKRDVKHQYIDINCNSVSTPLIIFNPYLSITFLIIRYCINNHLKCPFQLM